MKQILSEGETVLLTQDLILQNDDEADTPTPAGTLGTVSLVDVRASCIIYCILFQNGTAFLFNPEQDGKEADGYGLVIPWRVATAAPELLAALTELRDKLTAYIGEHRAPELGVLVRATLAITKANARPTEAHSPALIA